MSSVDFRLLIIVDKIRLRFGFVVTLISSCVFFFASSYIKEDLFYNRFIIILLSFVISINLLIYSGSIFFVLIGWDGLGITSFALIIYYQNKESLGAGFLTIIINRIGDVLIVTSIFLLLILGQINIYPITVNIKLLVLLLSIAALTKRAQYPLRPWLPAAIAAPTPVRALVHSSTLVTAGIYLIIRLRYNISISYENIILLCFCGRITCLLGGIAAIVEMDLKKIIALSTLSQLGVIIFRLGINLPIIALFHLYTHAIFKALLFLVAGVVLIISFGVQDIRLLGGVLYISPILVVFQNIRRLCLIGAPFLRAFYSKHVILELILISNLNIISIIIIVVATICTAVYVFRRLKILCWGKVVIPIVSVVVSVKSYIPLFILGTMGVVSGKLFWLLNRSNIINIYLPSFYSGILNIFVVLGVLIGVLIKIKLNLYWLSSLFFLTPTWNIKVKSYSVVSYNIKNLDYGWFELITLVYPFVYNFVVNLYNLFLWPRSNQYSFIRGVVFCLLLWIIFITL